MTPSHHPTTPNNGRTDDGRRVITIAHPEHSSGELKKKNTREKAQNMLTMLKLLCRHVYNEIFVRTEADQHE